MMQEHSSGYVITAAQIRAARALLGWSREDLSRASGVSIRTLARIETDGADQRRGGLAAVRSVLEAGGVKFVEPNGGGAGVRLGASPR